MVEEYRNMYYVNMHAKYNVSISLIKTQAANNHSETNLKLTKSGVFMKYAGMPRRPHSPKLAIFSINVKVIDLGVIWKGFISWVCMPNMKSLSLTVQKLWPRLKLFGF